ncbi:hypothetical protein F5X98DRAFT_388586 [Xylaria grammica]|nr:hypothetical protein F5X98DRAFT_388586 [Xylaria grammica]
MAPSTQRYLDKLKEQIQDSLVVSISEHYFIPTDKLHEILTISSIRSAVGELLCGPEHRIKLADTIYREGKRVFAMLIYNDWQDYIIKFREHGTLDSRLPLSEDVAVTIAGRDVGRRLAREIQWVFCPYKFPKRMWEHDCLVDKKMVIPFTSSEQIGSGASSIVEKVGISPSQQNFMDKGMKTVHAVRKRLIKKGGTEDFNREVRCLRLLNQLQHSNIIPLWGSYAYRDEHNFLFPYIGMDLGKFLLAKSRHQDFQWDFTFYSALAGLASALSKTHRLLLDQAHHDVDFEAIGYHHDLRPPNVLVCADTFILADFGLGSLKRVDELSHTQYKSISGDYIAPECTDMQEIPQSVNRAIDVWAFGCLIAEVVTYLLKGVDAVEEFRRKRLTPGRLAQWKDAGFYRPDGAVKKEVVDWMEALRREHPRPNLVPRLIDICLDALQPNPQSRPKMETIHRRLATLSMQKHYQSVCEKFREVQGTELVSTPLSQQHLESLQFAQSRFEVWGCAMASSEDHASTIAFQLSDSCVATMKSLLHALGEGMRKRILGDSSSLLPFSRLIADKVNELWESLPGDMSKSAESRWKEVLHDRGLDQHHVDAPAARPASPTDALRSEFKEAARLFKDSLPSSVPFNEISGITTISDVYDFTDKIQADQHRSGGLRNLPKIRVYLERLDGYVAVIKDIISGNSEVLALLWGPIVLLLQLAGTLDNAYDAVIDSIAKIGQYFPNFQASDSTLNRGDEIEGVTVLLFKDILNFYREVLQPFTHQNWMYVFDHLWPKYYGNILEVARHIERLARLMRKEVRLEHIQQEYEFRERAVDAFRAQAEEARRQEYHRIRTSFNPHTYDKTLYHLDGLRCPDTGSWLFQSQAFLDWVNDPKGENRRVLWLKGIPGAGKTVLSSAVVNHLAHVNRAKTAFAFLTYQDATTSALSTIHSLIFQLVGRDANLMAIVCESVCDGLESNLTKTGDLLASLIRYAGLVYVVLDGVDEIGEVERGRLVTELLRLSKMVENLRIIFSTRPEADLMRLLENTAAVINVHDHNEGNIKNYIDQRTQYIFYTRGVFPNAQIVIKQLLEPLVSRAKGMFLYARLIMDMVATSHDLSEIQRELTILPESLDAAYHRIIVRLGEHKDKRRAEQARKLLGWIACTSVPITPEEAQQALLVRPDDRDQVFNIVAGLNVVEILGPIVEIVDTYIQYISSPHLGAQLIDTTQATMDLAVRCIGYLCQRHHDSNLTDNEIHDKVCKGQYSFHAFSIRMWFELVCQYLLATKAVDPPSTLVSSLQMLWEARKTRGICISAQDGYDNGGEPALEILKTKRHEVYQVLGRVSEFRHGSFIFTGKAHQDPRKERDDPMSILSSVSQRIRRAFDDALCEQPTPCTQSNGPCPNKCAEILQYYGPRPFKCGFPQCEFWQHGFENRVTRDKHELSHDKPLKCHVSGCEYGVIGFLSEKMRREHMGRGHGSNSPGLNFGIHNLPQDGIETILSDLVKHDDVDTVQRILSHRPGIVPSENMDKLRKIAAFQASDSMLRLLGASGNSTAWGGCVTQSIEGRNVSTLEYLLDHNQILHLQPTENICTRKAKSIPYKLFLSCDWYEGTKVCSEWLRRELNMIEHQHLDDRDSEFRGKRLIQVAARHQDGNQQLLCLWEDSGLVSRMGRKTISRYLRHVAEFNFSRTLARFLLDMGADVNGRVATWHKTALQYAARNTSLEAAEMMEFLLLHGADPETHQQARRFRGKLPQGKKISEEEGAQNIQRWLGKTWEELIEDTQRRRGNKETSRALFSGFGEGELDVVPGG